MPLRLEGFVTDEVGPDGGADRFAQKGAPPRRGLARIVTGRAHTDPVPTPLDLTQRVPQWSEGKQRVINGHPVPPRAAQRDLPDVPVLARLEWSRDGEEARQTVAFAGFRGLVLVLVSDARCEVREVWLDARYVHRRSRSAVRASPRQ